MANKKKMRKAQLKALKQRSTLRGVVSVIDDAKRKPKKSKKRKKRKPLVQEPRSRSVRTVSGGAFESNRRRH